MLREMGEGAAARSAFERAVELATSESDRRFLARQIEELS